METTINRVIKSNHSFFIYEIFRGLKYIHSAGVVHTDLKPENKTVSRHSGLACGE